MNRKEQSKEKSYSFQLSAISYQRESGGKAKQGQERQLRADISKKAGTQIKKISSI
jgi:hypothetical protein